MNTNFTRGVFCAVTVTLAACAPQATAAPVDVVGTMAVEIAAVMQTQTAGAHTPTSPPPAASATVSFTETPSSPPTETPEPKPPAVVVFAGCYSGPGENYTLISNIDPSIRNSGRQRVTILGMGSEPGWVVIRNPYFNNPCWIRLENMEIGPQTDLSQYPVMTPAP